MIEAELKARLRDPDEVRGALGEHAWPERATYEDTYYDDPAGSIDGSGRELRLRTKTVGGHVRHILTYKEPAVDAASGSKPEHETVVADRGAVEAMLRGLGYAPRIAFTKRCENYALGWRSRDVLATVATVPELAGTWLEIETLVPETDMAAALADLRALLSELGVDEDDLTVELYTDAVAAQRTS